MAEQTTLQQAFDDTWGAKPKQKDWDTAYTTWHGDQTGANLRQVVGRLDPVINSALHSYVGQQVPPTVRQRAKILAARAIRSYDLSRGAGLNTHVYNQLRELQRSAPQISDPLAPPQRFRQQQVEIDAAQNRLNEELGREATDEEVSEVTGLPLGRVRKVRSRMRARIPMSVYEDSMGDDDGGQDIVGGETTERDIWLDAVYSDLGELDQLILMHRTGYRGADVLSNTELAQRLNLSPAAVSKRAKRIQRKLDAFHDTP